MKRLLHTIKTDVTVQVRNKLYTVGLVVAALVGILLSQLAHPDELGAVVPATLLLVIGGTTLVYVAGMIIFERDEGTINMVIVSPLRTSEYLWSKIISLTFLAMLEAITTVGGALLILFFSIAITVPNVGLLLLGIITIGIMYTLTGIILVVRYDKITDFLIPMAFAFSILQLPFLYFLGLVDHTVFLLIPTSAPTVLMQGAYQSLSAWEWLYAVGYTTATLIGLSLWARRAFEKHIVMNVG